MESSPDYWWEQAETWNPLPGDLCPIHHLASHLPLPCPFHIVEMAYTTTWLHSSLHTGWCRNGSVHGDLKRVPCWWQLQSSCPQTHHEPVQAEASRTSVKPSPHKEPSKLEFKQSEVDKCIFYYKRSIFIVFTNHTILLGPDAQELDNIVSLLQQQFKISNEGNLCDYLGIQMKQLPNGSLELTQPHLIHNPSYVPSSWQPIMWRVPQYVA